MNYFGSWRRLLCNANAAMLACIELYNKPTFQYRDECSVILLLNAWELLLKAVVSKHRRSIFYPKDRRQPYRTLSWTDALLRAQPLIPKDLHPLSMRRNLELLGTYRDNSVHFYNAPGFGVVIYSLAQTAIVNFRDLQEVTFHKRLEDEINWHLLPLGINPPVDAVTYISGKSPVSTRQSGAVKQFLAVLAQSVGDVRAVGGDTGRLMTVFAVTLKSVKKVSEADIVIGVDNAIGDSGPLAIIRQQDPNLSHPLLKRDVVPQIGELHGKRFTTYTFQAIVWKYSLKDNDQYCWRAKEGFLTRYSNDIVAFIRRLSRADLETAVNDYKRHIRGRKTMHVSR